MRTLFMLFFLFAVLTSCNNSNNEKSKNPEELNSSESKNGPDQSPQDLSKDQPDSTFIDANKNPDLETSIKVPEISGTYINTEHLEDNSCSCYCVEVKTTGTTEVCLKKEELYIRVRFQKVDDHIDVYFVEKAKNTTSGEIPWDKFDTGIPIAVLKPEQNSSLNLDWKGFSMDGKLAVEYALLGKKTLEGNYKKK